MSHYQKLITEATGRTDPFDLHVIEDCMRNDIFHSTLDWQSRKQFISGAQEAEQLLIATYEMK